MNNEETPKNKKNTSKSKYEPIERKIPQYCYTKGSETSNICNPSGESVTDDTDFRPDVATIRDKAIALQETGGGNIGVYDINSEEEDKNTPIDLLTQVTYARSKTRDITEIERARDYLNDEIEKAKIKDKENLKNAIADEKATKLIEKIEENTRNSTNQTENV